jgi:broad specificity phosphatase PhoE
LVDALTGRAIRADQVVTGTLRRQQDTARHWTAPDASGAAADARWNEYDDADVLSHHSTTRARIERHSADTTPDLTSRDFQVLLDAALSAWVSAGPSSSCRQTWPDFLRQVIDAFEDLVAGLRSGETALAITSSGVIAALAGWLIELPGEAFVALNRVSVNTGITKIVIGRQGRTLVSFNEHTHLEGATGPLLTYR